MATIGITIPESVWSARSERYYTLVLHRGTLAPGPEALPA